MPPKRRYPTRSAGPIEDNQHEQPSSSTSKRRYSGNKNQPEGSRESGKT